MLLKFGGRRGAKECKFDRSRQELSNECVLSLAKIDVDTAEKESSNICQQLDSYYWID